MTEISKDKDLVQQMQKVDNEVRENFNRIYIKFEFSKEVAIEAAKFRIQEELVIHRKMQALVFTTSEQMRMSN